MEERLQEVSRALGAATQTAALLPDATDLDFHISIDPTFKHTLERVSNGLHALIQRMSEWVDAPLDAASMDAMLQPSRFSATVGDAVDRLLEQTDTYLDEYAGRRPAAIGAPPAAEAGTSIPSKGKLPRHLLQANIPRPQDKFTTRPDNRAETPWNRPLRRGKPHAQVPLGYRDPAWGIHDGSRVVGQYGVEGDPRLNPYYVEIQQTTAPLHALRPPAPCMPEPLDMRAPDSSAPCPFEWVDTLAKLEALSAHLEEERVQEIAVDLEHHSLRTYAGMVSLMQISTRWGDWIVDTLVDEVREHAEMLNTSFTHPAKVLVLHGADHDVLWLQRDLGLYVTNLFDTFHASKLLNFGANSLAYLLLRYLDFEADKRFQMADWRIRPLPNEMLFYARSDTHSLLYVYDRMREELLAQGGPHAVKEVFERSKATASKVYAKEAWDPVGDTRSGWRTLWLKMGGDLARASQDALPGTPMGREERLVRCLHQWRDTVAREEDESPHYVMPPQVLVGLAFRPPSTVPEAAARIPKNLAVVHRRLDELVRAVVHEQAAYQSEAQKRVQDAAGDAWLGDEEDVGEAVEKQPPCPHPAEVPSAVRQGRLDATGPPADVRVWDQPAPHAVVGGARLFRGLQTSAMTPARPPATKKRASLFDRAVPGEKPVESTLQRIRAECAQWLGGLLGQGLGGAAPKTEAPETQTRAAEAHAPKAEAEAQAPEADTSEAATKRKSSPAPQLDVSDEEDVIVPVAKHPKHQPGPRAPRATPAASVPEFDYTSTPSVLSAPRAPSENSMLHRKAKPVERGKGVRSKSTMRSGQRSGTFSTGKRR